jgi:CopA family copper-resistance protein
MQFLFLIGFLAVFTDLTALAKTYDLEIKKQNVFITGKAVKSITVNNSIPGPTLRFSEGEDVIIRVKNLMDEKTSIHWHGILLPGKMDGVPGLNGFNAIAPGQTFTYKFKVRQAGTYWYHSHFGTQEQQGLYGSIVITPQNPQKTPNQADRDYVIVLSDFTEENSRTILHNLKLDSGYYNYHKRTIFTFFQDVKKKGCYTALKDYLSWSKMRMDPTDLSDVSKYHFLLNGKTNNQNWTGIFKKGERVKLRFINASAMTIYDVSIPGLKMKLVEADGQPVKPILVDEFRFGVAETYDLIVEPKENKAYTIFAESLDRSGYALGTLAPKAKMTGKIPPMRPRTILNMSDMAMDNMKETDHDMDLMDMDEMTMDDIKKVRDPDIKKMYNVRSGWANASTPAGHKALSYFDLAALHPQKDLRRPARELEFRFGGSMNRYIWTINGKKFPAPTYLKFGEKVRLKFINNTMMAHPIHLHGMFMQIENGQPLKWMPNKHTVIVPPAQTVSMLLTANEEGQWAFHCHMLYHMESGMMTNIVVERTQDE